MFSQNSFGPTASPIFELLAPGNSDNLPLAEWPQPAPRHQSSASSKCQHCAVKNVKNVQELYAALVKFPHLQKDLPVPDHLKLGLNITLDTVVTTLTRHSLRPNEKLPEITSSNFTSFSTVEGRGLQVDPATVINIAKSVWDIVRDNAGVVNISTDYATATPSGITRWEDLENWKNQGWDGFHHVWINALGLTMCEHKWNFGWAYGGDYKGEGRYVTQATEHVQTAYAAFIFTLSASGGASNPLNVGSSSHPVGQITIDVKTKCCCPLYCDQAGDTVLLKGDGAKTHLP